MFKVQLRRSNSRNPVVMINVESLTSENNNSNNTSLEQFSLKKINDFTDPSYYKVIESTCTTLAGTNPAHKVVFAGTSIFDNHATKGVEVWTLKDNKAYVITSFIEQQDYIEYSPTIQKIIDSFEIMN